jgi:hypothetical protein
VEAVPVKARSPDDDRERGVGAVSMVGGIRRMRRERIVRLRLRRMMRMKSEGGG